jgi:hypothetical protein
MSNSGEASKSLYRIEYYEPEDNDTYTEWVWLQVDEVHEYRSEYRYVKVRRATEDEQSLYEEAYEDGYSIAAILEFESKNDGITYRVELDESGDLAQGRKMFQCPVCKKHRDFETEVAMANDFYLTTLVGENLWHICYDCAMITMEVDGINFDFTQESEADS